MAGLDQVYNMNFEKGIFLMNGPLITVSSIIALKKGYFRLFIMRLISSGFVAINFVDVCGSVSSKFSKSDSMSWSSKSSSSSSGSGFQEEHPSLLDSFSLLTNRFDFCFQILQFFYRFFRKLISFF